MADNAPNAVSRPPFPNVVVLNGRRVEVDLVTFSLAAGTPTLIAAESTGGVSVSTPGSGRVAVVIPAATTGTVGWVVVSCPKQAALSDFTYQLINANTNFVTGVIELNTLTAGAVQPQTSAGITLMVYRIKAPA